MLGSRKSTCMRSCITILRRESDETHSTLHLMITVFKALHYTVPVLKRAKTVCRCVISRNLLFGTINIVIKMSLRNSREKIFF